jgi:hypothetical protein
MAVEGILMHERVSPPSSARVKIVTPDNATFQEAYQFDDDTDTSWTFSNKTFRMDIKANREATTTLLSLTSGASQIIVDDVALRILHFNVPEATLTAAMPAGEYVYDLIMIDADTIRTPLMHGEFVLDHGVTGG